ncbi:phosphoglyceromutase [Candidatus Riesia sp. GBBU]|nr:phosphoglyceromutase [Candidatus Riesia sp. GBBU]
MNMVPVVLVRHGESVWNKENKFTGWIDVELSENGKIESKSVGNILKEHKFSFDIAYTSLLKRSIQTLWSILKVIDQCWIPVKKTWKLNERHYGSLQGLDKTETMNKYGINQVKSWRRGFKDHPPSMSLNNLNHLSKDPKYKGLDRKLLPVSESLQDTERRVISYWNNEIMPKILMKKKVIIVSHGNSLRSLIKHIDKIEDSKIDSLDIPTAKPIVYEFDKSIRKVRSYFLKI